MATTQQGGSMTSRTASETRSGPPGSSSGAGASSSQTGAKFRHGLLQLMIHTIDPLHDGKYLHPADTALLLKLFLKELFYRLSYLFWVC